MNSPSVPGGPSRGINAPAARDDGGSVTSTGARAASAVRTSVHVGSTPRFYRARGPLSVPAGGAVPAQEGMSLGQPQEGHVRRQPRLQQHLVDLGRRDVSQLVDL